MKRLVMATLTGLLVLSSCSGGSDTAAPSSTAIPSTTTERSTTSNIATTSPTTAPPASSTTGPPPTYPPDPLGDLPAIVTAEDGVYEVAPNGLVRQLISGSVAFAIDDTQGGLLYQVDRGRDWDGGAKLDTRIWWLPAGSTQPRELLVPTRAEGHELSLHDVYFDGAIHVVYVRHEGERSHEHWPFNLSDRLRSFDMAERKATDLAIGSAHEAGIDSMQCGDGLIAYTDINQVGTNCEFIDHNGVPVSIPADVEPVSCEIDCRRRCAIGWDGKLLMYSQDQFATPVTISGTAVAFVDARTAEEISRVVHAGSAQPEYVDLLGNRVLLSWSAEPGVIYDMAHLGSEPFALPIAGRARFAKAPIELPGVVSIN